MAPLNCRTCTKRPQFAPLVCIMILELIIAHQALYYLQNFPILRQCPSCSTFELASSCYLDRWNEVTDLLLVVRPQAALNINCILACACMKLNNTLISERYHKTITKYYIYICQHKNNTSRVTSTTASDTALVATDLFLNVVLGVEVRWRIRDTKDCGKVPVSNQYIMSNRPFK